MNKFLSIEILKKTKKYLNYTSWKTHYYVTKYKIDEKIMKIKSNE